MLESVVLRAGPVPVWKIISGDIGVSFGSEDWSDVAHAKLTPMPMVDNAMASAHEAATTAFAAAV
jgi:hypothetical protein